MTFTLYEVYFYKYLTIKLKLYRKTINVDFNKHWNLNILILKKNTYFVALKLSCNISKPGLKLTSLITFSKIKKWPINRSP